MAHACFIAQFKPKIMVFGVLENHPGFTIVKGAFNGAPS